MQLLFHPMDAEHLQEFYWIILLTFILIIWEALWKTIAMWKSARNNDLVWFICIALINTLGILPIIYILMDSKKKHTHLKEYDNE